jgi:hypothetical protein
VPDIVPQRVTAQIEVHDHRMSVDIIEMDSDAGEDGAVVVVGCSSDDAACKRTINCVGEGSL